MPTTIRLCFQTLLATAVLAAVMAPLAHSRAWNQKTGHYYAKISAGYLHTDSELDYRGTEVGLQSGSEFSTIQSFSSTTIEGYLEYGVSDRLTLVGKLPFKILAQDRVETNETIDIMTDVETVNGGLGDLTVGARTPLKTRSFPIAVEANIKLPLAYQKVTDNGGPALGSGEVDIDGSLLVGFSLYPFPGYVEAGAGYRVRGGSLNDQYLFAVETGARWRRWFAKVTLDGVYSVEDPEPLTTSSTGGVVNQDVLKILPGVSFSISDTSALSLDVFHVLDGKNSVTGTTYSFGLILLR